MSIFRNNTPVLDVSALLAVLLLLLSACVSRKEPSLLTATVPAPVAVAPADYAILIGKPSVPDNDRLCGRDVAVTAGAADAPVEFVWQYPLGAPTHPDQIKYLICVADRNAGQVCPASLFARSLGTTPAALWVATGATLNPNPPPPGATKKTYAFTWPSPGVPAALYDRPLYWQIGACTGGARACAYTAPRLLSVLPRNLTASGSSSLAGQTPGGQPTLIVTANTHNTGSLDTDDYIVGISYWEALLDSNNRRRRDVNAADISDEHRVISRAGDVFPVRFLPKLAGGDYDSSDVYAILKPGGVMGSVRRSGPALAPGQSLGVETAPVVLTGSPSGLVVRSDIDLHMQLTEYDELDNRCLQTEVHLGN